MYVHMYVQILTCNYKEMIRINGSIKKSTCMYIGLLTSSAELFNVICHECLCRSMNACNDTKFKYRNKVSNHFMN